MTLQSKFCCSASLCRSVTVVPEVEASARNCCAVSLRGTLSLRQLLLSLRPYLPIRASGQTTSLNGEGTFSLPCCFCGSVMLSWFPVLSCDPLPGAAGEQVELRVHNMMWEGLLSPHGESPGARMWSSHGYGYWQWGLNPIKSLRCPVVL